jgi:DNA-directed RNA polymerase II subunit RPB1
MEDATVRYDSSVRNDKNDIIQIYYGEDSFDGVAIEWNVLPTLNLSDVDFENQFNSGIISEWTMLQNDREFLRVLCNNGDDRIPLGLNINRILIKAKRIPGEPLMDRDSIYQRVLSLRNELKPRKVGPRPNEYPTLFQILLSSSLNVTSILKNRLTVQGFDYLLETIKNKYYSGLIQAGESVGVLAAQSIGEPATQMTLK